MRLSFGLCFSSSCKDVVFGVITHVVAVVLALVVRWPLFGVLPWLYYVVFLVSKNEIKFKIILYSIPFDSIAVAAVTASAVAIFIRSKIQDSVALTVKKM